MANPTSSVPRTITLPGNVQQDYPISGTSVIYQGTAVSDVGSTAPGVAGTNVAANLTAGENFLGFANGDSIIGQTSLSVTTDGQVALTVAGLTAASNGASVYASDGNTFTLTSTSNSKIGVVRKILSVANTLATVAFAATGGSAS
jgi:hypothetical protein